MTNVQRAHPTAKHEAGQTLIPVDCDVCRETMFVAVPRMPNLHAVWVGRGHTAAAQRARCEACGRACTVELSLSARVVTLPPQPFLTWSNRCGTA